MTLPQYVIVVGVDYSAASERALDEALSLACTKRGVQLHIANVRSEPARMRRWPEKQHRQPRGNTGQANYESSLRVRSLHFR